MSQSGHLCVYRGRSNPAVVEGMRQTSGQPSGLPAVGVVEGSETQSPTLGSSGTFRALDGHRQVGA